MAEQPRVVDFAGTRLVATGVIGKLDVSDTRQVLGDGIAQFTFHALCVVDVVLDEQIVGTDLIDDFKRLRRPTQEETRDVVGIDRLDQQFDPGGFQLVGSKAQVVDKSAARRVLAGAGRDDAGQAVDLLATESRSCLLYTSPSPRD